MTPTTPSLDSKTKELGASIDAELEGFLRVQRAQLEQLEPSSVTMVDDLIDLSLSGGKRIRPILCCLSYEAAGGGSSGILRVAASLELLHVFALIHDDFMDEAGLRRGRPTVSRLAEDRYGASSRPGIGGAVAVLTGDLAFVLSDRLYFESGMSELLSGIRYLNDMRLAAIAGQFADLTYSGLPTRDQAGRIARLKTAHYSVSGPLLLGAALAGAHEDALQLLRQAGETLGEAFQLGDDLTDAFGDPAFTGKEAAADLRSAKPTLLLVEALSLADEMGRESISRTLGRSDASPQQIREALAAISASGAVEVVEGRIKELTIEGTRLLDRACAMLDGDSEKLIEFARSWVEKEEGRHGRPSS